MSRPLSLDLSTDEMLVTCQLVMCERKKFQHVRTGTLVTFVRLCGSTISKPPAPRDRPIDCSTSHDTSHCTEKCLPLYSPPLVDAKGPALQGANAKLKIQNKPSIHENMKIRFTIVSIKKHWATVCTVESSLNYRQVTHEAKKRNHNCLRVFSWTSEQSVPCTQHIHPLSILAHIHSLLLSLWTLISRLEFKKKKKKKSSLKTKPMKRGQTCLHLSDKW